MCIDCFTDLNKKLNQELNIANIEINANKYRLSKELEEENIKSQLYIMDNQSMERDSLKKESLGTNKKSESKMLSVSSFEMFFFEKPWNEINNEYKCYKI